MRRRRAGLVAAVLDRPGVMSCCYYLRVRPEGARSHRGGIVAMFVWEIFWIMLGLVLLVYAMRQQGG